MSEGGSVSPLEEDKSEEGGEAEDKEDGWGRMMEPFDQDKEERDKEEEEQEEELWEAAF